MSRKRCEICGYSFVDETNTNHEKMYKSSSPFSFLGSYISLLVSIFREDVARGTGYCSLVCHDLALVRDPEKVRLADNYYKISHNIFAKTIFLAMILIGLVPALLLYFNVFPFFSETANYVASLGLPDLAANRTMYSIGILCVGGGFVGLGVGALLGTILGAIIASTTYKK